MITTAMFWENLPGGEAVKCNLCERRCIINDGAMGNCHVRMNFEGALKHIGYGILCGGNPEPIEKQPFSKFLPGSQTFVIGSPGCNFHCKYCINCGLSQLQDKDIKWIDDKYISPSEIVESAIELGCESITFAYTEPAIYYEYMYDVARRAKSSGLKTTMVTNGYMSLAPLTHISKCIDAVNIDFKGTEEFYSEVCGNIKIEHVLQNIRNCRDLGLHTEVTTLIIPGYNDSMSQLKSIAKNIYDIDPNIVWHLTKFYPAYLMKNVPITSDFTLDMAKDIGKMVGLKNAVVWR